MAIVTTKIVRTKTGNVHTCTRVQTQALRFGLTEHFAHFAFHAERSVRKKAAKKAAYVKKQPTLFD